MKGVDALNIGYLKIKLKRNHVLYTLLMIPYSPIRLYHYIKNRLNVKEIVKFNKCKLIKIDRDINNVFYFGVPVHMNMGDLAQTDCTKKWIVENYPDSLIQEINTAALLNSKFLNDLKKKILPSNIIFIQSGYCSHEFHADHKMHKVIVESFPDNRIIILPQTVNISSESEMMQTAEIFNRHRHLMFLARDQISYAKIKDWFVNIQVEVYPDVVTTLIGSRNKECVGRREGILLCMRDDAEKLYSHSKIKKLLQRLQGIYPRVEITDTDISSFGYKNISEDFECILQKTIIEYESYQLIITDRYHGTIFAAIANTPVIVLATNDHKVKSGIEWFKENNYCSVFYADTLEAAFTMAKKILKSNKRFINENCFAAHYYNSLKNKIDTL